MTQEFNPYYYFLGIPRKDRLIDHYMILGIERFETNEQVIEMASDRQMSHLGRYESGDHADDVAMLLNEVSRARLCLLNPEAKAAYDAELRSVDDAASTQPEPLEPEHADVQSEQVTDNADLSQPSSSTPSTPREQAPSLGGIQIAKILDQLKWFRTIDLKDFSALRESLQANPRVDRQQVEVLFQINDAVISTGALVPGWQDLFVRTISKFASLDASASAESNQQDVVWLLQRLLRDQRKDVNTLALLNDLKTRTTGEAARHLHALLDASEPVESSSFPIPIPVLLVAGGSLIAIAVAVGVLAIVFGFSGGNESSAEAPRDEESASATISNEHPELADEKPSGFAPDLVSETYAESWPRGVVERGTEVEWKGKLKRIQAIETDDGQLLLRVVLSSTNPDAAVPEVEGYLTDSSFAYQLADLVTAQEDPESTVTVNMRGEIPATLPWPHLSQQPPPTARIESVETTDGEVQAIVGQQRANITMSEEAIERVVALRTVGKVVRFPMTIEAKDPARRQISGKLHERIVHVNFPATWSDEIQALKSGEMVTVLARRADSQSDNVNSGIVLEALTLNQPSFSNVEQQPEPYDGTELRWAARLLNKQVKGSQVSLGLEIIEENVNPTVTLAGWTNLADVQSVETWRESMLLDVTVRGPKASDNSEYSLVSCVARDQPGQFVTFQGIADLANGPTSSRGGSPQADSPQVVKVPAVELIGHAVAPTSLSWSSDERVIAVCHGEYTTKRMKLWSSGKASELRTVTGIPHWSPTGEFFHSFYGDYERPFRSYIPVYVYSKTGTQPLATVPYLRDVTWLPGNRLLTVGRTLAFELRSAEDWTKVASTQVTGRQVNSMMLSPTGDHLAVADDNGVDILPVTARGSASPIQSTPVETIPVPQMTLLAWRSDRDQKIERLCARSPNEIIVWHCHSYHRKRIRETRIDVPPSTTPATLLVSHDGRQVAQITSEELATYDMLTGQLAVRQPLTDGAPQPVMAPTAGLIALADGSRVTVAGMVGNLVPRVDIRSPAPIVALVWHPRSTFLATSHTDHVVRIWNLEGLSAAGTELSVPRSPKQFIDPNGLYEQLEHMIDNRQWKEFHKWCGVALSTKERSTEILKLKRRVIAQAAELLEDAIELRKSQGNSPEVISLLRQAVDCDPEAFTLAGKAARQRLREVPKSP